jgi:hypothetical protein
MPLVLGRIAGDDTGASGPEFFTGALALMPWNFPSVKRYEKDKGP